MTLLTTDEVLEICRAAEEKDKAVFDPIAVWDEYSGRYLLLTRAQAEGVLSKIPEEQRDAQRKAWGG